MPTLYCYLERGFSGEEVEVMLGGRPIFQGPATTDLMMGFAAELTESLPAQAHEILEVGLPAMGLADRTTIPGGEGDRWVRIRLEGGRLMVMVDTEPLGFL
ncbi:MAG: hypothetical protein EA422_05110 [Gemmatimonadales bacterium]|nr:MAG: hypothetical protein EA422_05110 [Gemmatimonadales bacterium]